MPSTDTRPQYKVWPSLRPDPRELGLVAAYDLGKPVNNQIIDLVGPFNGTLYGGPIAESTPMGMGLCFDGADDYANIYDGRISAATQGSMGFWVKINTLVNGAVLFGYGGAAAVSAGAFTLQLVLSGGNYYFRVYQNSDGGVANSVFGSTALRTSTWYYVELVSDGSAWYLYVNGVPQTLTLLSGVNNGNWFGDTTATAPTRTRIGATRFNGGDISYFPGTIIAGTISDLTRPDSYQRNEYLRGKAAMWRAGYGVGTSAADEGGILGDSLGKQSGVDTGIRFGDTVGRFRIVAEMVNGKMMKVIQCNTAGLLYIPIGYLGQNATETAFGTVEFWFYKSNTVGSILLMLANSIAAFNAAGQNCYYLNSYTSGAGLVGMGKTVAGVASTLCGSVAGSYPTLTWYKFTATLQSNNVKTIYINDSLVSTVGGSGTNPVTDSSHSAFNYIVIQMLAGDKFGWSDQGEMALKKSIIAK